MVRLVRAGTSMNSVAQQFKVDPSTVWLGVHRAEGQRLDRVDFADRKSGRAANRTRAGIEQRNCAVAKCSAQRKRSGRVWCIGDSARAAA